MSGVRLISADVMWRKVTPDDNQSMNIHYGFVFSVFCVKVGRLVITKVHFDADPEESTNFRHAG
ncbi:hypothetical protein HKBW3S06_00872 [Candidatus Hakubella thermalkaliphila]|uniref:Uncharacterized protein n=1 Tax=Candidatus Hakubella thermalkaliphila TaxID=2754717 RepID=A0A6V8NN04_9ACTN|nr:hypothetical protein HKBW3S06_00872 [Candidatus Hakubella thermalkaliphila]